ncbi:hypothetical protein FLL45_14725 [Aliikangiella marina]|uniref:Uncharacterized protein n=1 Tax=Aliikangiella marina TaxID=1712262 RepID=A0A545TA72_9GAMM|nr:hypothetical protein [Aliikangiella marina]TQV74108.1 hypothetical protein FLL45_14725 [Aliikangiella marina]
MNCSVEKTFDGKINTLLISGVIINRWLLARALRKVPGLRITVKPSLSGFYSNKPILCFSYKNIDFVAELDPFSNNQIEIREKHCHAKHELLEVYKVLNSFGFPYV